MNLYMSWTAVCVESSLKTHHRCLNMQCESCSRNSKYAMIFYGACGLTDKAPDFVSGDAGSSPVHAR